MEPYRVALVLDPHYGERLRDLASAMHVWAIKSPANSIIAKSIWDDLPKPSEYNIESGITTFDAKAEADTESQLEAIVGSIDQHHDELSHDPGYSELLVYGVEPTNRVRSALAEFGFETIEGTDYGFKAVKREL